MNKPVIQVSNISKSYKISHELKASAGTVTIKDAITNIFRKPAELVTGHKMRKEKFWALRDVSFDIAQGEVVGIIGKNGSGKSTLLKIMSQIVEPTHGNITMVGRVASLLEVGTGFHPELTGRENIYFNGSILGMKKKEIDSKFEEIVAFSEVEKFLDTPVKFYSSGMYVRLAFAVAAHLEPDILIVDEVLAVGDTAFQKKCLGKMRDVAGQGRTVMFVSHSMSSVQTLCNKAILLSNGRLAFCGRTSDVIQEYIGHTAIGTATFKKLNHSNEGKQNIRIDQIQIFDSDQKPSPNLDYGKPARILLSLKKQQQLKAIRIDLNVYSQDGTRIACLTSEKPLSKNTNEITLCIKSLPFSEGTYYCNLSVLSNESDLEDFIPEAIYFNVRTDSSLISGADGIVYEKIQVE